MARATGRGKTEVRTNPPSLMLFNFDIDGDNLKEEHKAFLRVEVIPKLQAGASISVLGFTDRKASAAHNKALSDKRVARTVEFLRAEVPSRFALKQSTGFGEEAAAQEGAKDETLDERFRAVLIFLSQVAPVDKGIQVLTLWLNAFIDKNVKNGDGTAMSFALKVGPHSGESVIPGPFNGKVPGFDDCYLTDQRSFDSFNKNASSRIHAEVRIDFTGTTPILTPVPPLGANVDTVRLRVSTGKVLNTGRGVSRGGFRPLAGFVKGSKEVTVRFNIAGNNPIAKMPRVILVPPTPVTPLPIPIPREPSSSDPQSIADPDIDMLGTFTVDAQTRMLKFRGLIDGFPFFEGYVTADGGSPVKIFQEAPEPGESPASGLPGPPRRVVEVDKRIP